MTFFPTGGSPVNPATPGVAAALFAGTLEISSEYCLNVKSFLWVKNLSTTADSSNKFSFNLSI